MCQSYTNKKTNFSKYGINKREKKPKTTKNIKKQSQPKSFKKIIRQP